MGLRAIGLALLIVSGCAPAVGNSRLPMPSLSPSDAAAAALAEYDANKDGALDEAELARCPALKSALKSFDRNNDRKLTADEIAARLATYRDSRIALIALTCHVRFDGRPLDGATVEFVPEKFLGPAFKKAVGSTDREGTAQPSVPGEKVPGLALGLYRVQISKTFGGTESVPARYNAQTELGVEVAPDRRDLTFEFDLKSH